MKCKELTAKIIQCAFKVHKNLGFGFLESVYQNALAIELSEAGLKVDKEKRIQVNYDGLVVGTRIRGLPPPQAERLLEKSKDFDFSSRK